MADSVYKFVSYGFVRGKLNGLALEHEYGAPVIQSTEIAKPEVDPITLVDNHG